MARTNTLGNFLTDVAAAIRTKKGSEEPIAAADFDTEIENLPSGEDLSEYFVTEYTSGMSTSLKMSALVKKLPDLIVDNNITSLNGLFNNYDGIVVPRVVCGSNIINMQNMYYSSSITSVDASGLNTSNVTNMANMFSSSANSDTKLGSIIFGENFKVSKCTTMVNMFKGRAGLSNLDLSDFKTSSSLGELNAMFSGCASLKSLDLSGFYTSNVTNMSNMFYNCKSLVHIDMRNMTFSRVASSTNIFGPSASEGVPDNCEIIVKGDTEKSWITDKFTRLTNVKTVAEYEAEQNA